MILILLFVLASGQKATCPQPTSMFGMAWKNLKDTIGMHAYIDWLPVVAYGKDPAIPRCAQAIFRNDSETCGDLNVAYMYQAISIMIKAYTGYGILKDTCVFDVCPYITTIAESKHVDFKSIDCRRATMMLECAMYHIPRILLTIFILSIIFIISFILLFTLQ